MFIIAEENKVSKTKENEEHKINSLLISGVIGIVFIIINIYIGKLQNPNDMKGLSIILFLSLVLSLLFIIFIFWSGKSLFFTKETLNSIENLKNLPEKFDNTLKNLKEFSTLNNEVVSFTKFKEIIVDISYNYCHGNKMIIFGVNFDRFGDDQDRRELLEFCKNGNTVDIICTEYRFSTEGDINTNISDFLKKVKDEENIFEILKNINVCIINKNNLKAKITVFDTTNAYYQPHWNFIDNKYDYKDLGINIMDKNVLKKIRTDISQELINAKDINLGELLIKIKGV